MNSKHVFLYNGERAKQLMNQNSLYRIKQMSKNPLIKAIDISDKHFNFDDIRLLNKHSIILDGPTCPYRNYLNLEHISINKFDTFMTVVTCI